MQDRSGGGGDEPADQAPVHLEGAQGDTGPVAGVPDQRVLGHGQLVEFEAGEEGPAHPGALHPGQVAQAVRVLSGRVEQQDGVAARAGGLVGAGVDDVEVGA